jgi:predicted RNA-binding protein associated with RNAse of E/G family
VHWWRSDGRGGFYVDAARSLEMGANTVSFVDLYLDLAYEGRDWLLLDEEELSAASEEDAAQARAAIEQVRQQIAAASPLFDEGSAMWRVPPEALELEPRAVERLE